MKQLLTSTPLLAIICCLLWGSSFVPTKLGLEFMPAPLQYAGYTFLVSGLLLLPWTGINRHLLSQFRHHGWIMLKVALFTTTILYGSYYLGQSMADGSLVALIVSCQPFFVALLAHWILRNERFTPLMVFSLALCIIGMTVVSWPSFAGLHTLGYTSVIGIAFILIDCLSAAYGNIVVSRIDFTRVDIKVLTSAEMIIGGGLLLILAYPIEGIAPIPSDSLFYVSFSSMVFINTVTMIIWLRLLARPNTKVSHLNMWKFLIPITGSVECWTLLHNDSPTVYSVTGLVIIVTSLIIFHSYPRHTQIQD